MKKSIGGLKFKKCEKTIKISVIYVIMLIPVLM